MVNLNLKKIKESIQKKSRTINEENILPSNYFFNLKSNIYGKENHSLGKNEIFFFFVSL